MKREECFFPGASSGVGSEASTGTYKGILNFISYETGGEKKSCVVVQGKYPIPKCDGSVYFRTLWLGKKRPGHKYGHVSRGVLSYESTNVVVHNTERAPELAIALSIQNVQRHAVPSCIHIVGELSSLGENQSQI